MSEDKPCMCLQCRIDRTISEFKADNPGTSPRDVLDDLACALGLGIGRAFNATQDHKLTGELIEHAVRQMSHAVMTTTKGKLKFELSDVQHRTMNAGGGLH